MERERERGRKRERERDGRASLLRVDQRRPLRPLAEDFLSGQALLYYIILYYTVLYYVMI